MAFKTLRIEYTAKNFSTGLTDVKAQVYFNGVAKAVGGSALVLTEVDATNAPGLYELVVSGATLATWGAVDGQANYVTGEINSATRSAPAPFKELVVSKDAADVEVTLGSPAGASVSADIANILSNIQQIQNGVIANGVGYVLPNMLIPDTGSNTYKIPITVQNNDGALVDPVSQLVTVGILNAGGTDRGSYLTGSSGSPATVAATRDSLGQYHAIVVIPSSAVEEELLFSFAYTIGSNAMVRYGQAQLLSSIGTAGLAQQTTLLAVQSDVSTIKADVESVTTGLAVIAGQGAAIEGAGFTPGTDDLHSIATYLNANLYSGGVAK